MKYFLSAIALVIATPAAAQTAPAQDHQGPGQHQQHGQHQGHAQHQQHRQQGGQSGHAPQGDCCADRNGNGRMDCCERMAEAGDRRGCCAQPTPPAPAAQPQRPGGH
jgi:hypothetical protein